MQIRGHRPGPVSPSPVNALKLYRAFGCNPPFFTVDDLRSMLNILTQSTCFPTPTRYTSQYNNNSSSNTRTCSTTGNDVFFLFFSMQESVARPVAALLWWHLSSCHFREVPFFHQSPRGYKRAHGVLVLLMVRISLLAPLQQYEYSVTESAEREEREYHSEQSPMPASCGGGSVPDPPICAIQVVHSSGMKRGHRERAVWGEIVENPTGQDGPSRKLYFT